MYFKSWVLIFTHLHNLPRVLLNSALWRLGYWSPNLRRAAWAHTMKAFMGRFTCVLRFSSLKIELETNYLRSLKNLQGIVDSSTSNYVVGHFPARHVLSIIDKSRATFVGLNQPNVGFWRNLFQCRMHRSEILKKDVSNSMKIERLDFIWKHL